MEKITKEGKEVEEVLQSILEENNLTKEDIIYSSHLKRGKLFQGNVYDVTVYEKNEVNNTIKDYLRSIVENMGLEVRFEIKNKDGRTTIKMYSNNDPILIGRNGKTIKALETIVSQMIQNETGVYYKFNLDVSDYKDKIVRNLQRTAKRTAKEVANTKIPATLDNMTSYERRIVHEALSEFKGVTTESEGEEPNRHIVIKPVD